MHHICICGCFLLLGLFLGIIYDIFKILRLIIRNNFIIFVFDISYFIIYTFCIFILNLLINMGYTRYFFVIISFLSTLVYKFTISRALFRILGKINSFVHRRTNKNTSN